MKSPKDIAKKLSRDRGENLRYRVLPDDEWNTYKDHAIEIWTRVMKRTYTTEQYLEATRGYFKNWDETVEALTFMGKPVIKESDVDRLKDLNRVLPV